MEQSANGLYAELYDASGVGWPGEIDFYRRLADEATARGEDVLEVACGTGRVALALAREGARVTGIDRSPEMIRVARAKTGAAANPRWVEADMRAFDLGQRFGLVLIPAHSFQFMLTPEDQIACLACVGRHLAPGGRLVLHLDHQDLDWLGGLPHEQPGTWQAGEEVVHPGTGRRLRRFYAWSYQRASQTATVVLAWEEVTGDGGPGGRRELAPMPQHCAFRFEIAHLLARAGLGVEAVYGDFAGRALGDESSEMIWVARASSGP